MHAIRRDQLSEQSTKYRSRSENVRKVCLFYRQNNKIVWLSNMADTFFEKFARCAKVCGLFFLIVLFECWLAEQANSGHMVLLMWLFNKYNNKNNKNNKNALVAWSFVTLFSLIQLKSSFRILHRNIGLQSIRRARFARAIDVRLLEGYPKRGNEKERINISELELSQRFRAFTM